MNQKKRQSDNEYGKRTMPSPGEFLHPSNIFRFLWSFISGWFLSRDYRLFFMGTPFLIFLVSSVVATWLLGAQPEDRMALDYERAAMIAMRDARMEEADLMWEQLMTLRPDEKQYQYTLLLNLVEQKKYDEAQKHVEALIRPGDDGYTPARIWLVMHARGEDPVFEVKSEKQSALLKAAIEDDPHNRLIAEAHRLLAQTYIERNDLRLAEQHLLGSVRQNPILGLLLVELQERLGRELTNRLQLLRDAERAYALRADDDPGNPQWRNGWSHALVALNKIDEARSVLTEGANSTEDPEMRTAMQAGLADFYLGQATAQLQLSAFRRDDAARLLVLAIEADPQSIRVAQACMSLAGSGATFTSDDLAPLIAYRRSVVNSDLAGLDDRILLTQLLAIVGEYDQGADLIAADAEGDRSVTSLLVRMKRAAGHTTFANQMAEKLVAETRADFETNPDDPTTVLEYADALVTSTLYADAVLLIDAYVKRAGRSYSEVASGIRNLYVTQCVAAFDDNYSSSAAADNDAFQFLQKGVECRLITPSLVQRLAKLSATDETLASRADDVLVGLLATGDSNAEIYSIVGTEYLRSDRPERAAGYLKQACALSPNDPLNLNNYALALIRWSRNNYEQAMDLCERVLEKLPDHPDVLSTRAEILVARSHWDEARRDLEIALPVRPESANVRKLLVQIYTEVGEEPLAEYHKLELQRLTAGSADVPDSN